MTESERYGFGLARFGVAVGLVAIIVVLGVVGRVHKFEANFDRFWWLYGLSVYLLAIQSIRCGWTGVMPVGVAIGLAWHCDQPVMLAAYLALVGLATWWPSRIPQRDAVDPGEWMEQSIRSGWE